MDVTVISTLLDYGLAIVILALGNYAQWKLNRAKDIEISEQRDMLVDLSATRSESVKKLGEAFAELSQALFSRQEKQNREILLAIKRLDDNTDSLT